MSTCIGQVLEKLRILMNYSSAKYLMVRTI